MKKTWVLLALAIVVMPSFARADAATAEALFDEGRRLMDAGQFAEACPKFVASQKSDPAIGTLLNLGECWVKSGKTASAWATFREVVAEARRTNDPKREAVANERLAALEKHLAHLKIIAPEGVTVLRDGAPVDSGELGLSIPIDPGSHVVEARATGKKTWRSSVDVRDATESDVRVPALADETIEAHPVAPVDERRTQRTIAIAVAGVGVVGLGVGTYFGFRAKSEWSDAEAHCTGDRCRSGAASLSDDASGHATLSTVGFVVGAVGVAGGVVLWLTAPKKHDYAIRISPYALGLAASGGF